MLDMSMLASVKLVFFFFAITTGKPRSDIKTIIRLVKLKKTLLRFFILRVAR